jgi:hypothetical protein
MRERTIKMIDQILQDASLKGEVVTVNCMETDGGDLLVAKTGDRKDGTQAFFVTNGRTSTVNPKRVGLYHPDLLP